MDRLTKRRDDGTAWYNHSPEKQVLDSDLLQKLAKYEDTGWEPEEIVELKKLADLIAEVKEIVTPRPGCADWETQEAMLDVFGGMRRESPGESLLRLYDPLKEVRR